MSSPIPGTPPPGPEFAASAMATARVVRRLRASAHVVLAVVAAIGAGLSYTSLRAGAADVFDDSVLSYGFPLLVDALVLGASLQYVAGARAKSPGRFGWRLTAHAAIAATLALNALAAYKPGGGGTPAVPWHITAPAVWAVLVELYARTAAGQWRAEHADTETSVIPARLWLTAPIESARTWLHQARRSAAVHTRADLGRHAAALEALRLSAPGRPGRRVRRILRRQLRAGSLTPQAVLTACGWHAPTPPVVLDPHTVLRAALTHPAITAGEPSAAHGPSTTSLPGTSAAPSTPAVAGTVAVPGTAPELSTHPESSTRPGPSTVAVLSTLPVPHVNGASEHAVPSGPAPRVVGEHVLRHTVLPVPEHAPSLAVSSHVGAGSVVNGRTPPARLAVDVLPAGAAVPSKAVSRGGVRLDLPAPSPADAGGSDRHDQDAEPDEDSPLSDAAIVAHLVAAGHPLPSVRAIKRDHRVGNVRAARIRALAAHDLGPDQPSGAAPA